MSKYNARCVRLDGYTFQSAAEAAHYADLRLRERAGEIAALVVHPRYPLAVNGQPIGTYVADFRYTEMATGAEVVADVKGVLTPVYRLKKKLVRALYGIAIVEVAA